MDTTAGENRENDSEGLRILFRFKEGGDGPGLHESSLHVPLPRQSDKEAP